MVRNLTDLIVFLQLGETVEKDLGYLFITSSSSYILNKQILSGISLKTFALYSIIFKLQLSNSEI